MSDTTSALSVLVRDAMWQSSAVFLVGLLVARTLLSRHPARAHAVLVLTFVAALAAPVASALVRECGWGLLEPEVIAVVDASPAQLSPATVADPTNHEAGGRGQNRDPRPMDARDLQMSDPAMAAAPTTTINPPRPAAPQSLVSMIDPAPTATRWNWAVISAALLVTVWIFATLVTAARLARGVWSGLRLLGRVTPCEHATVTTALAAARQRLDLGGLDVEVAESDAVHCPVIWCWGRRPRLVLPPGALAEWSLGQWTSVLCHELAHWKRRDHWTALVAEATCCLLPWQPLAWWAKRRLAQAAEQACDDWALAAGNSPTLYAETLLGLVAQGDSGLALAAVSRHSGLPGRIRHILTSAVPRPRPGRLWSLAVMVMVVAAVIGAALCQRGVLVAAPPKAEMKAPAKSGQPVADVNKPSTDDDQPKKITLTGRLTTSDGRPVAGAQLYWVGMYQPDPDQSQDWMDIPRPEFARAQSDAEGQFRIEAELVTAKLLNHELVVRAEGCGVRSKELDLKGLDEPIELELDPAYAIEGTVFTPNGEPVKDARVLLTTINRSHDSEDEVGRKKGWGMGLSRQQQAAGKQPDYWPAALRTDAEGRFRIDDVVPESATTELTVEAPEYPKVRLSVAHERSHKWKEQVCRDPKFTLVLETPYVVTGQYTDQKTGQAIAGVKVEVMPMHNRRGGNQIDTVHATSDEQGQYQLVLGSADSYWVQIHPPLGYAGIKQSISSRQIEQFSGKKRKFDYPVKLKPGRVLRGRVVAEDTGEPVAMAQVVYHLEKGAKPRINANFEPVRTDDDGRFEVTGSEGRGYLMVDGAKGFYRLHLDDDIVKSYRGGYHPTGLLKVDVPAEGEAPEFTIKLKRGPQLVAHVTDPDGKPVKELSAAYVEQELEGFFSAKQFQDSTFKIDAVEPGRMYRVFLFSQDANAGKVAEIIAPADGQPIEIKLEPCATIRGRYVYEGGTPAPEVTNFSHFRTDPAKAIDGKDTDIHGLPFYDNFARPKDYAKRTTDADGNFELTSVVPGVFLYLSLNYNFADGKKYKDVGALSAGEVKEMGEVVIRPN